MDRAPWSVKGINQRARTIAREAARSEGVSLGEYLNSLILGEAEDDVRHNELAPPERPEAASTSTLDHLARRVEAVEARSTLAITGIDQSVMGLLARLEKAEDGNTVIAGHVDTFIEELRETHSALAGKVRQLEEDESGERNLQALKALEEALGKLAAHVYQEGEHAQTEAEAIKGRVEAGFTDLNERMEKVETRVETTLTEAARRVEETVAEAGSIAQAEARNFEENVGARLSRTEEDVSGALGSMEQTLLRVQERLNRAETTTDAALKGLEATFSSLDERISAISTAAGPEASARLRAEIDAHFEGLSEELRNEIAASREHMAEEISQIAAQGAEGDAINRVSDQVAGLAARLETRVAQSELSSAQAIEQIGEQVASVADRLQGRQDEAFGRLSAHVEQARSAQDARLSDALANMSSRIEALQADVAHEDTSPVQKAIASLAERLDLLEGQPITASHKGPSLGNELEKIADEDADVLSAFSAAVTTVEADEQALPKAVGAEDAFLPGLPEWAAPDAGASDEDYTPGLGVETIEPRGRSLSLDPLSEVALKGVDQPQFGSDDALVEVSPPSDPTRGETPIPPAHLDLDTDMPKAALSVGAEPIDEEPLAGADTAGPEPEIGLEEDFDASDYIARARRAAIAAAQGDAFGSDAGSSGGVGRLPLYAAASVIVLAAAGTSGFLYLRGKQSPVSGAVAVAEKTSPAPSSFETGSVSDPPSGPSGPTPAAPLAAVAASLTAPALPPGEELGAAPVDPLPAPAATTLAPEDLVNTEIPPVAQPEPQPQPIAATASFAPIPPAVTLASAAESGDRIASYLLGLERLENADYSAAAELISDSARKGLPIAQYQLAKLFEKGLGVPRDLAEARRWTEQAASGGNVRAMHDLAVFFADGEGGEQSFAQAVEWFGKAAEFGVLDSQYNLAVLYQQGLGISEDLEEAVFWFSVAAEAGDQGAADQVQALAARLDPEAELTIRARVEGWRGARANPPANGEFGRQAWDGAGVERVRAVQRAMNALGYDVGTADGVFGPATRASIRAYQRAEGLAETGTISAALVESLNAKSAAATT
ncbi:MAG: peptidoglycan-binding protein [Pseudomonadota bacterium]